MMLYTPFMFNGMFSRILSGTAGCDRPGGISSLGTVNAASLNYKQQINAIINSRCVQEAVESAI